MSEDHITVMKYYYCELIDGQCGEASKYDINDYPYCEDCEEYKKYKEGEDNND